MKTFKNGLKVVWGFIQSYRKILILLVTLNIILAIVNGVIPYFTGKIFDSIIQPAKIFILAPVISRGSLIIAKLAVTNFFLFISLWFGLSVISDILNWQTGKRSEKLAAHIEADYIANGFSKILQLPVSFHKNHKIGDVGDRITRAAGFAERIISGIIIDLSPQFISIIVAFIVILSVKPIFAPILFTMILIYTGLLIKRLPKLSAIQQKMHSAYNRAYGDAYEVIYNAEGVKQATAEKYESKKLHKGFRLRAVSLYGKFIEIWQELSFYQRLTMSSTQFIIFILAVIFIRQNTMTVGELVMLAYYSAMVFSPLMQLASNWRTIHNGFTAISRAEQILNIKPEKYQPSKTIILDEIKGEIKFQNVDFSYNKKAVLENINLDIKAGETIALVGKSGVGKSTVVDLISYYYAPKKGKILIDGRNIKNLDLKFLRSKIAVVPQEVVLFNDTIKNNIRYGNLSASEKEIVDASKLAGAHEFIEKLPRKYSQIVGERGVKLSVGQKQRVAIARAILRDPKILILDEPTSALDAESEKMVKKGLEALMKGRTTIIIAHRLSTVRGADKIVVLEKGRIVETGNHNELIKREDGVYKKLYQTQFEV